MKKNMTPRNSVRKSLKKSTATLSQSTAPSTSITPSEPYGEIGRRRPLVQHIKEEPLSYDRELEAALDAGDYTVIDDGF